MNCLRCQTQIAGSGPIETNYNEVLELCEECQDLINKALADYMEAMKEMGNYDAEDALAGLVRALYK